MVLRSVDRLSASRNARDSGTASGQQNARRIWRRVATGHVLRKVANQSRDFFIDSKLLKRIRLMVKYSLLTAA